GRRRGRRAAVLLPSALVPREDRLLVTVLHVERRVGLLRRLPGRHSGDRPDRAAEEDGRAADGRLGLRRRPVRVRGGEDRLLLRRLLLRPAVAAWGELPAGVALLRDAEGVGHRARVAGPPDPA